ncbi:hypothetical protein [Saccharibacillus kuerlensis]|uniref:Uncharacterized protein n=1 Tax=Saccharibacillus kuerlensis TaxID=459527 RepID=A0ABQ2L1I1_9BACL|nr:hypothetical protein [Saccharibacillus kuerlensis]GGN99623.1 hypothetical protein GCM10010969_19860 [Saccharibacillus kuerlensis]
MMNAYEQISVKLEEKKRKMNRLRLLSVTVILLTAGVGAAVHNMVLFVVGIAAFVVMLFGFGLPTMRQISRLKKQLTELASE